MTFIELILKIASGLGGILTSSSKLKRARRHDLGNLLERISNSLLGAAEKLEQDISPIEECAELLTYTQQLDWTLRKTIGFFGSRRMKHLVGQLSAATEAPSRAIFYLQSKSTIILPVVEGEMEQTDAQKEIGKMKQAGGLFRAAAELIRSGGRV